MSLKTLAPHLATALPVTTVGPSLQLSTLAFLESPLSCSSLLLATLMLSQRTGTQALNFLKPHIWGMGYCIICCPSSHMGNLCLQVVLSSGVWAVHGTNNFRGPCHLIPLCPQGLFHLVPLCLLPQNTDLLARSFLHTPRALPPAWGWWLATSTFPGRSWQPTQGINLSTSLSDPSIQVGL